MFQEVNSQAEAQDSIAESAATQAEIEDFVIELWSPFFPGKNIERTDNFFDLGGISIFALQFVGQVREYLDVSISTREFFDAPVVANVSAMIIDRLAGQSS